MSELIYDSKPSNGQARALEIKGTQSTYSLPFLPGPLWSRVQASNWVLSTGQIEQNMCANKWLMLIVTVI